MAPDKNLNKNKKIRKRSIGKKALGHHFRPFRRNQIRWALHLHKMYEGIFWRNYGYEIKSALNMKDSDKGINEKDPVNWIVNGIRPGNEKLALFEKYVVKEAPQYRDNLEEVGFYTNALNFFNHFNGGGLIDYKNESLSDNSIDRLNEQAYELEKYIYLNTNPLKNYQTTAFGFRKLGDTPCLYVYFFFIEHEHIIEKCRSLSQCLTDLIYYIRPEDRNKILSELEIFKHESTAIRNIHYGVMTPNKAGDRYIGLLKGDHLYPASLNLRLEYPFHLSDDPFGRNQDNKPVQFLLHADLTYYEEKKKPASREGEEEEKQDSGSQEKTSHPTTLSRGIEEEHVSMAQRYLSFSCDQAQLMLSQMKEPVIW